VGEYSRISHKECDRTPHNLEPDLVSGIFDGQEILTDCWTPYFTVNPGFISRWEIVVRNSGTTHPLGGLFSFRQVDRDSLGSDRSIQRRGSSLQKSIAREWII
jgi:hypothetical protein